MEKYAFFEKSKNACINGMAIFDNKLWTRHCVGFIQAHLYIHGPIAVGVKNPHKFWGDSKLRTDAGKGIKGA
jgi:hypothetical protein